MKKALTKVLLTAITLVIFAAIVPLSASASTSDNKDKVFNLLTTKLDLNPAAACGVMANIEKESNFNPNLIITDSNGLPSGGLCQWNGGRFNNLRNYCRNFGYDYRTIEGQIAYLSWEMASSSYGFVYDYLKKVPNNASGAYDAAWYWCYYFEIPSDRYSRADQRGRLAQSSYWPDYGVEDLKAPSLSLQNKKNPYDIDNSISFKWSDGGDDVTSYYLYVTAKNSSGKYDWSKAKIGKYNANTTAKTVKAEILSKGDYAACVRAYNSRTGKIINSNFTQFSVKCLSHQCVYTVKEPANFEKEGVMLITCKQCPASATKPIPKLTYESFKTQKMQSCTVTGYSPTKIRLGWSVLDGADGYQIFVLENSAWKHVVSLWDPDCTSYIIPNLEVGKKYTFNIRAFKVDAENNAYFSLPYGSIIGATTPETPVIKSITQKNGTVTLEWDKVEGSEGYGVYVAIGQDSSNYRLLKKINSNETTTFSSKGVQKGQFYYFIVKSYYNTSNGYSISGPSDIVYIVGN